MFAWNWWFSTSQFRVCASTPSHTHRRTSYQKKRKLLYFPYIIAIATLTIFIYNSNRWLKNTDQVVNSFVYEHIICYRFSCFVFYRYTSFIAGHRCCTFYKLKARPSTSKRIATGFIAGTLEPNLQYLWGMPVLLLFLSVIVYVEPWLQNSGLSAGEDRWWSCCQKEYTYKRVIKQLHE